MPVVWIADKAPLPDCGNCDGRLSPTEVKQVFIYDTPNEVPTEIKTGLVNLSICPHCGYRAWLWPGMLTVDRKRKRGVYCYLEDLPHAEAKLDECWAAAGPYLNQDEIERMRKRTVWVFDHQHIYQVLCESEETFSLEAVCGEKYRQRLKIADLRARAEQWLKDTEEIGANIMTVQEATPEFLPALRDVIREHLDGAAEGAPREALQLTLARIESTLQKSKPRPQKRKSPVEHAPSLVAPDDPLLESGKQVDLSRSQEVTDALTKLIRTPPAQDALKDAPCAQECLRDFLDAHHCLFGHDADSFDLSLEGPLAQMIRNAPDVRIKHDENITSLETYLSGFDNSDNCQLAMLGEGALRHMDDKPLYGAAFAQYLSRLWRATGSHYARFMANVVCSEFFSACAIKDHAIISLADACLSFDDEGFRKILMPQGALRIYAICWQRMGRYYSRAANSNLSPMCSGISANFFKLAGDVEGELRSRLDIGNFKITARRPIHSAEVEQLLKEIVSYGESAEDPHAQEFSRGLELECLYLLSLAQLAERSGDPQVMTMEMGYELRSEGEGAEPSELPPDFKLPVFAFADGDEPAEDGAEQQPPPGPAALAAAGPPPEGEAERHPGGYVLLMMTSFNKQPGYVSGVQVWGVEWLRSLRRTLKQAAKYKHEIWWHMAYYALIEQTQRIHPGIPIYFFWLMAGETEEAGFREMPPSLFSSLQIILAKCYMRQLRGGDSFYLKAPDFTRLLDAIEGGMFDQQITYEAANVQSLTGVAASEIEPRMTPESLTLLAEVLEAGGRFAASARKWQTYVNYCEEKIQEAPDRRVRDLFVNGRVIGLYRLARVTLKSYRETEDYDSLVAAMNAIEAYKARSILSDSDAPVADRGTRRTTTRFRTIEIENVRGHFPPDCFIVVFALMQATDLNTGFWFSALISPRDQKVLFPRFIEFDDVFKPATGVDEAFRDARSTLVGKSLGEVSEAIGQFGPRIQASLEELGAALFPADVVEYLERQHAERLIIVPESYLFDVPFPALKIGAGEKSRYLFELNEQAGTAISVSPNLTHFQHYEPKSAMHIGPAPISSLAVTLSAAPGWRNDLVPIYGVSNRLRQIFAGDQGTDTPSFELDFNKNGVQDFLDSLVRSRTALFFGHGEITGAEGSVLIANDGIISEHEVEAFSQMNRFKAQLLILCACSGINANVKAGRLSKDIAGVHVSLLKGGVRCVVGSLVPTFPICGIVLLKELLNSNSKGFTCDEQLLKVYRIFASHPEISSPIFWGHLVGFGDSLFEIS